MFLRLGEGKKDLTPSIILFPLPFGRARSGHHIVRQAFGVWRSAGQFFVRTVSTQGFLPLLPICSLDWVRGPQLGYIHFMNVHLLLWKALLQLSFILSRRLSSFERVPQGAAGIAAKRRPANGNSLHRFLLWVFKAIQPFYRPA